jgi:hypothetical protein
MDKSATNGYDEESWVLIVEITSKHKHGNEG